MKTVYYLFFFFLIWAFSSSATSFAQDVSDKADDGSLTDATSCDKGYILYKDKCVQDCDEQKYPLNFIPDTNRGEVESCKGKTTRYRYKSCYEEQGWYWDDTKTECLPAPCVGYSLSENELDSRAGTYESCRFYGKNLYRYTSCHSGWDGPEEGLCTEHKCSPSEYPYLLKSEADAVCADIPSECQEALLPKRYGCQGKCKENYYYSEGFCLLRECDEMYPYNIEENAAGCQKLRICSSENLISVFGCDSEFGCKKGYHSDKYRCLPDICDGFSSGTDNIPNCEQSESCLRGSDMVYKCVNCHQGYELIDGLCQEISTNPNDNINKLTCQTGDIYYSDNTCEADIIEGKTPVGIVVDSNHNLIMALSYERQRWDTFDSQKGYDIPAVVNIPIFADTSWSKSVQEASKDLNGEYNSDKFIEYERQIHVRFPAIEYCNDLRIGAKKWFIPSAGQLLLFEKNSKVLNNTLLKIKNNLLSDKSQTSLLDHYFWSSTEASLPCSEDDNCYKPNQIAFIPNPKHMIVLEPIKAIQEHLQGSSPSYTLNYVGKYFTSAPVEGVYALCFANYENHDIREESNNCGDYPFYNEESESIYTNINDMYDSGRAQKASILEACTDSYGTWYKPTECAKGYTLDEYGCYPTDCSMYRLAPTSPEIEGCRHFVTCETANVTYYMCDLCDRPYELTREYTCVLR